ncbi:hypothetical protein [Paracoccus pantotrophus]|uniref:hypothetical protein n=1 Tax=Paracoccus pantotrophus TaxID=82367 RepID=UPI00048B6828|nr:hypothetical protein [Paracoccus pantotrophus]
MSAPEMPERIWLIPDIGWDGETAWSNDPAPEPGMDPDNATEYLRADLCASGQQVRAMMDAAPKRIARIIRENLSGVTSTEADIRSAQEDDLMRTAELIVADLCALTPAPQPAGGAVPTCVACEDNPKHPNIPCAVCGAHPPQPSETVAEALSGLMEAYKEIADSGDAGFWKAEETPEYQAAVAALRALKGGDANG